MKITFLRLSKLSIAAFSVAAMALSSCQKEDDKELVKKELTTTGVYVLCEGPFGVNNNSEITYHNTLTGSTEKNYYQQVNGGNLGNNANDLQSYGSKLYCVITGTSSVAKNSFIDVMSVTTAKSIKRISLNSAIEGYSPRYIAFDKNKAYISCYNGMIVRIDTTSLTVDGTLNLDKGLDQLSIVNNKLYVTNSKNFQYPGKGNVVSVVDLNTFAFVKDIEVAINPTRVAATKSGDLWVLSMGTYDVNYAFNNDAKVSKISSSSDTKTSTYTYFGGRAIETIAINDETAYVSVSDENYTPYIKKLNLTDGSLGEDFIKDGTTIATPYGLYINTFNKDVYVADANGYAAEGKMVCFGNDGRKKFDFSTSSMPKNAVFVYGYK